MIGNFEMEGLNMIDIENYIAESIMGKQICQWRNGPLEIDSIPYKYFRPFRKNWLILNKKKKDYLRHIPALQNYKEPMHHNILFCDTQIDMSSVETILI